MDREERDAAYDKIDRYLRNNLDDADYADFSAALECVYRCPSEFEQWAERVSEASEEMTLDWLQAPDAVPNRDGWYRTRRIGWGGEVLGATTLWWDGRRGNWYASMYSPSALSQSRMWSPSPTVGKDAEKGEA